MFRALPLVLAFLGLVLFVAAPTVAGDKEGTHEGLVVKAGGSKITMTDKTGKNEHTHAVSKTAKIVCENKECKLEDLKQGYEVKVTIQKEANQNVATRIEAKKSGS